ncbi:hypothetical protein HFN89_00455 [Rhizobium laguerreae]|nr:hypothetical protein [Rhizobium laguerreae]
MQVDYRYPSMVRGRIGAWQKDRHVMVSMTGCVEVDEIGSGEAPLAATVTMQAGEVDFRLYIGRLYRAAPPYGLFEFRSGLDNHMAAQIADACHLPVGRDVQPWPKTATDCLRHSDSRRDGFHHVQGEFLSIGDFQRSQMISLSSLGGYEQEDVERWAKVAADYVENLLFIDGVMWMPVREPMLATVTYDRFPLVRYVDASFYDGRSDNPKDQPTPFGRRDGFVSPFWDPGHRVYPLHTIEDLLADGETLVSRQAPWLRPPEIHLPDAFGQTYAQDELDRVSRAVVSELHSVYKSKSGSFQNAPSKLREYCGEMRRLLSGEVMSEDVAEGLARRLKLIRYFIIGAESEGGAWDGHWKSDALKSLIVNTVDMWANREINLDVSWPSRSGGPSGP